MRRVSAMFRPALRAVSYNGQAVAAALAPLRRGVSHRALQSLQQFNRETKQSTRLTGSSASMLLRSSQMREASANANKGKSYLKSGDTARVTPHTKLATATATAVDTAPVSRLKTPEYREYARYRNSIREDNMWRDPSRPETNWLKPRCPSTYKPDFANTEPESLRRSFMRSPDEKSKDMANRDLAKAVQKLRYIPSPAPMSATAQVVRQTADALESYEQSSPRGSGAPSRRSYMRSSTELVSNNNNNKNKRF